MVSNEVFENYEKLVSAIGETVYSDGSGFSTINFNGKPLDLPPISAKIVYFKHIYRNIYPNLATGEQLKARHRCLSSGYFCFENFQSNPKDIFDYLYIKSGLYRLQKWIRLRMNKDYEYYSEWGRD